ncbi:C2 domain-containing protein 3 isoform X1 [Gasterosteus aculeatus]
MKNRKHRSLKAGCSKKRVPSDVSPATSLPPLVEGELRCFLQVSISRVLWTIHKPPSATFVRLRWWGESSNGTHFFPRDGSHASQKTIKTTSRFPIRCGPKQFTSYLTDMSSLVLELLTKPDHLPIARAEVAGISRLSLSHPISGFYTLVSPTSEKLGELQVSLNLEPLTEAYDSSSSGPIPEIGKERPQITTLAVPSQPRTLSAGSGKGSAGSSSGNTPRGKDHLYFQNAQKDEEPLENLMPTKNKSHNSESKEPCGQATTDILAVILERGNKLRNAMVVSALHCDTDSAPALKDTPLPLPKDNILLPSKRFPSPTGGFLQNILFADSTLKPSEEVAVISDCSLDCPVDMDNRAVDLLLGRYLTAHLLPETTEYMSRIIFFFLSVWFSLNTSPLHLWDGDGSIPDSLSGHSSVCEDSELNDPQYDQSLLENLFYKTTISDIRPNDTEAEGQGTVSPSKHQLTQAAPHLAGGSNSAGAGGIPPGVSAELMSLLSSIRLARVAIDSLAVSTGGATGAHRKTPSKGKPPRAVTGKKCTYFIEYVFPVASTSSRHDRSKSGDGEVTRAAASKVTGGMVKFHQPSVFPVHFDTSTVKKWWGTDLIFNIYSRKSDQKKPVPIGKAVHPLRCLLESKQLSQSVVLPVQSVEADGKTQEIGPLKVSLALSRENRDFPSEKSKRKVAQRDASPSHTAPSPQRETSSRSPRVHTDREELPTHSLEVPRLNVWTPQKPSKEPSPHPGLHTSPHRSRHQEEDSQLLLHTLLMVPDGKNFNCGPMQAPNVYLNCKLWCDETARSVISWGQANPCFNFVQVTPVALTSKLLERMKNNVMVIEVWQKTASSGQDRLLGIVKLPLHQFYMSFRDPKITHLLLQAQYPVLGVDCYMPVVDVFSGSCNGHLRVVLAMGRSEQIISLQRTRDEEYDRLPHLLRPVHLLDHQPHSNTKGRSAQEKPMREHLFVIRVEGVKGLTPLQSTVWGEADCYVQYGFPCQEGDPAANLDQSLIESSVNLKPFRTTTTLCVPDPLFGHAETHVLLAPEGLPVQRLLLSSLSSQGLSSGGGVQFEVWCRYYYPNVRDQLVAKGVLPLAKLCAMVTMQRQHPNEAQKFSLPLIPRTDSPTGHQPHPSGLLDVCIRYKHRPVRPEGRTSKGVASRVVTLVVQVHRASGLQAAARVLSEQDERFSYFAGVGVNSFITVEFSFLPESERRCTRMAPRTFCPEFDHHMEVSCDLLLVRSSGETCSLAEQLVEASAVFTVWNKDNRKAVHTSRPKDVVLGTVKIPLADLIHKRTGISGWFGVYTPQDQHTLVGGLEISVTFAHHSDRERVIKAAQGLSWEISQNEMLVDEEALGEGRRRMSVTFAMPRAWIPVHCLLLPGLNELERSTYCYFRYKFYDQDAFCSQMRHPAVEEGSRATVAFQESRTVELKGTQPLMWYLREEKLEVQVWVAFTKDKAQRPRDTDRLVGSAFVDLSPLTKTPSRKPTLSGVYPLFRRSAADLQGAALRVHIALTTGPLHEEAWTAPAGVDLQVDSDSQEEPSSEKVEAADRAPSPTTPKTSPRGHRNKSSRSTPHIASGQHTGMNEDDSFPVTIAVDQAMHLNLKGCPLAERSEGSPSCCVSYLTADSAEPVSTTVLANTDCPVWDHQHECRLSKQLLVDPQQSLVFKVWHKGETERVIGFAPVDLSPLVCGFQSVCGWYNITDFSGQCHGQLKVSITPQKGVQDLREQRKTVNEEASKNSPKSLFQALPLSYHTTATNSSFPSHISRYSEQKISSPDHTDKLFSERSSESERHFEHMDQVRHYHQSLQEQTAAHSDISPSSSFLFSALRKKLSELDHMQRYFSRKISTPTFPSVSEQEGPAKHEEQRDTETDTSQLLLKSNHLVGQVNSIINGLRGNHLETIPSDPQSNSTTSPVGDNSETLPESISSPRRATHAFPEDLSPLHSPKVSGVRTDSEAEEEKNSRINKVTASEEEKVSDKDEDGTGSTQDEEADDDDEEADDDEEDYEEVVVKPRHLNEVTSLTDKTSPWTSILSEPDWISLRSPEAPEEPFLSEGEDEKRRAVPRQCEGKNKRARSEGSGGFNGSGGEVSDTERDCERTIPSLDEGLSDEPDHPNKEARDNASSPTTDTDDASCSTSVPLQTLVPTEIPNFFLPSHQLEASMRVIRLAPSFSNTVRDPGPSAPHHRGPGQRPNMSPSSMKKETERIKKIFAARFDVNN